MDNAKLHAAMTKQAERDARAEMQAVIKTLEVSIIDLKRYVERFDNIDKDAQTRVQQQIAALSSFMHHVSTNGHPRLDLVLTASVRIAELDARKPTL